MNPVRFDTLKLANALEDSSFTPEQAEGIARAIAAALRSDLATRADLDALRMGIKSECATIGAEFEGVRQDVKAGRALMRAEISAVRADLLRSLRTLVGIQVVAVLGGLVGAVVTLLHVR